MLQQGWKAENSPALAAKIYFHVLSNLESGDLSQEDIELVEELRELRGVAAGEGGGGGVARLAHGPASLPVASQCGPDRRHRIAAVRTPSPARARAQSGMRTLGGGGVAIRTKLSKVSPKPWNSRDRQEQVRHSQDRRVNS